MMGILHFLNPWYLAAAAAALLPFLFYLLQRQRVMRIKFGSVWFLRDMARRVAHQRRRSELLLLLLRALILILLAGAFARPVLLWRGHGAEAAGPGAAALAILVDLSGSMKTGDRMQAAREAVIETVNNLNPGDTAALYGFDHNIRMLVNWTADPDAIGAALEDLRPLAAGSNLSGALRRVQDDILERREQEKEIVVVSDMQAAAWSEYRGDWVMSEAVTLSLVDVSDGHEPANIGIVGIETPRRTVLGAEVALGANVRNFTTESKTVRLELFLQDEKIAGRDVFLDPDGAQVVSFPYRFELRGHASGKFSITARNDYAPDNEAFFVVSVEPKIKILAVNGMPSADPNRDGVFYLVRALAPSDESPFEVETILPEAITADLLNNVSVLVFSGVDALSADIRKIVERFVLDGGGLMLFPGLETNPERFNRTFSGLAPCRLDRLAEIADEALFSEGIALTEMNTSHPALQLFKQPRHGDLSAARFHRYFTVSDSQASTVLARFANNRPAVLVATAGRGASMLMVSAVNREMNDFAIRANFVPFLQETTRFLGDAGGSKDSQALIGIEENLEMPVEARSAIIIDPRGNRISHEVRQRPGDDIPIVRLVPETPGIYRVLAGDDTFLVAANPDPSESDLRSMGSDEIAAALTRARGKKDEDARFLRVTAGMSHREHSEKRQRLGWYLLLAAVALLMIELHVADRMTIRD